MNIEKYINDKDSTRKINIVIMGKKIAATIAPSDT